MKVFNGNKTKLIIGSSLVTTAAVCASVGTGIGTYNNVTQDSNSVVAKKISYINTSSIKYTDLLTLSDLTVDGIKNYLITNNSYITKQISSILGNQAANVTIGFDGSEKISSDFDNGNCNVVFKVKPITDYVWSDGSSSEKSLNVEFTNIRKTGTNDSTYFSGNTYSGSITLNEITKDELNTYLKDSNNLDTIISSIKNVNRNVDFSYVDNSASISGTTGTITLNVAPTKGHYWNDFTTSTQQITVQLTNISKKQNDTKPEIDTIKKDASAPSVTSYNGDTIYLTNPTTDNLNKYLESNSTFLKRVIDLVQKASSNVTISSNIIKNQTTINDAYSSTIFLTATPNAGHAWSNGVSSASTVAVKLKVQKIYESQLDAQVVNNTSYTGVVGLTNLSNNGIENFSKWSSNSNFFNSIIR